jgi:hypothetical protein
MKSRLIFVFALVAVLVLVLALKRSGYTRPNPPPSNATAINIEIAKVTGELANASPENMVYLLKMLSTYQLSLLQPKVSPGVFEVVKQMVEQTTSIGRLEALANQTNGFKMNINSIGKIISQGKLAPMIDRLPNQMQMAGKTAAPTQMTGKTTSQPR